MELNDIWDSRFLRIAEEVSTWSKTQVQKLEPSSLIIGIGLSLWVITDFPRV